MSDASAGELELDVTIDWAVEETPVAFMETEAADLMQHALHVEGQSGPWELAFRFVSDDEMCHLHEQYLQDPSPTDIMTFPYDPEDGTRGGDIVISVDQAVENAREYSARPEQELQFLMLHGLLHILGWDDQNDESRQAMLERQETLLASWVNPEGNDS